MPENGENKTGDALAKDNISCKIRFSMQRFFVCSLPKAAHGSGRQQAWT